MPSWLLFDGRRRAWYGTPTSASRGNVTAVVVATDPFGATATGTVIITVVNAALVYLGRVYDQQTSQDATGALSFGVAGFEDPDGDPVRLTAVLQGMDRMPPWLHFDAATARFSVDGSGAPAGSYFLVVTGEDATGARSSVTVKLDVQARAVVPSGACGARWGGRP